MLKKKCKGFFQVRHSKVPKVMMSWWGHNVFLLWPHKIFKKLKSTLYVSPESIFELCISIYSAWIQCSPCSSLYIVVDIKMALCAKRTHVGSLCTLENQRSSPQRKCSCHSSPCRLLLLAVAVAPQAADMLSQAGIP